MTEIVLGVTNLLVDGKPERPLKCPCCDFKNIHKDTITHHIRHTDDVKHDVDVNQLDENCYIVTREKKRESPYGPYVKTQDLPLPWIRCLWCSHRDKIEFDLSLHMLERYRENLSQLPIYRSHRKRTKALSGNFFARFEGAIEFRLDVAVEMAKEQNRGKGVRHAVRILQRRAVERRKASAGQGAGTGQGEQRLREADAMKDPEVKRQWEKLRQEWLHKWPTEITSPADRYVPCKECHKPMVKKESGTCDYCVWYDIWWNQGGIRVDRQNWGEV